MPKLLEKSEDVTSPKSVNIRADHSGWYIIGITAIVKDEKQRMGTQSDDEELIIQLNDLTFPKPNSSNDLKNAPASFNGGSQHDFEKTVQIIVALEAGDHVLTLTPQHGAMIEEIWYDPIQLTNNQIILSPKIQSEDRDSQPWISYALVDSRFSQAKITAKVWWRWRDGDDLQVRINGIVQENKSSKKQKYWIFSAGSIFDIFGRKQTEEFALTYPPDIPVNYIELWADRKPYLEEVIFSGQGLEKMNQLQRSINNRLHQYSLGSKRENFNNHDQEILRATLYWNDYFSKQDFPPPILLDPNLIKAIMFVESKMGYFQAGADNYPASPDVMQIADPRNPAIHTLNYDGWIDPGSGQPAKEYSWSPSGPVILNYEGRANGNTEYDSIYWAIRWLYHKAEIIHSNGKRSWRTWPEAVSRYNGGGDPEYLNKVETIYEKGDWR